MARWKAHGQLSILVNWTFFAIYHGSGVMRRNVYSSAIFTVGRPLCTETLPGQGHPPSTNLGITKLGTPGYQTEKTAPFCVPSFWHNTGVWWTDRQPDREMDMICCSIYCACKASFVMHCKNQPTTGKTDNDIQLLYETIPKIWSQNSVSNDEMKLLEVRHHPVLKQSVAAGCVSISSITKFWRHLLCDLWLLLQCHWHQLVLLQCGFWLTRRQRRLFLLHRRNDQQCFTATVLTLNPFNASCFKLLLSEGLSAILV